MNISHLVHMMKQVKEIKYGIGLQGILDAAYKILKNPIAMFNTEYRLLAYTDVVNDDPIWAELIEYGTFSIKTQKFFYDEGFIEELANAPKIVFMSSKQLKYDRVVGKIFNKNNSYVSNLVMVACNKPFEEHDSLVFEAVCKLISREISRSEFFQAYEQTHQETIIKSLIDGSYTMTLDLAQVGSIYDSLESGLYVAVVDISQCGPEYTDITYFRDLLMLKVPAFKYAVYSNYIIIIISTNYEVINVTKELSGIIEMLAQYSLYAGISDRFENLFELQRHYQQARKALQYTLDARSSQRIFPCDKSSTDKMQKIEELKNGEGIQYFLNKGAEIFGNPLLFHDMELNLLGYTENMEISDPIWQELITYGTSSYETIELFRTEGFIDIMDNTKAGAMLVSEKIKYDRISWRIYNSDNIRIGCTSIVNTMKPFTEDELVLFGTFSHKFSKEVGKIEFYNNYGQVYSGTVINRLLSGKIDDYTFYSEDIGNLYDNLMENLYLVVVDTSQCGSDHVTLTYIRDLFNWPGTLNRYAIYADYIVIIISFDNAPLDENNEFCKIQEAFEQHNMYAGMSCRFGNIYELQQYYNEALNTLKSGMKNKGETDKQRIFYHDNRA